MDREPELHPSGIIRVHPVDPCSRHGSTPHSIAIAIAIEASRLSNSEFKRAIWNESHPCRPGWETEAASFRKMGKQLGMDR